jgi:hypothetical protein
MRTRVRKNDRRGRAEKGARQPAAFIGGFFYNQMTVMIGTDHKRSNGRKPTEIRPGGEGAFKKRSGGGVRRQPPERQRDGEHGEKRCNGDVEGQPVAAAPVDRQSIALVIIDSRGTDLRVS